jgi:carnitine O-acetyltransferase
MASQPRRTFNTTTAANAASAAAEEPETKDILNLDRDVLPRLPVPDLKSSCELFLKSVKPLATEEEFNATEDKVNSFVAEGGLGSRLQKRLEDFDGKQEVCEG